MIKIKKVPIEKIDEYTVEDTFKKVIDEMKEEATITVDSYKSVPFVDKLQRMGFMNNRTVLYEVNKENEYHKNKEMLEAINVFAQYPYKFISEEGILKVCKKYNLAFGTSNAFLGNIPEKNMIEISNFKLLDVNHGVFQYRDSRNWYDWWGIEFPTLTVEEEKKILNYETIDHDSCEYRLKELYIAGPASQFDTTEYTILNNVLQKVPQNDPIVFHPVQYKSIMGFLIISAWGSEADIEEFQNPKNN